MKNFTKQNFKTNLLWIRLLIMAFMLLGASSAWAANNVAGGYVYFDNTKTGWSDACIQFVIGHSSFSRTYTMTKITNTNLYYVNLSSSTYHDWSDATYYAVIGTSSKWGDGSWGSSNLTNATHRTAAYTTKYDMDGDTKRHLIVPSTSSNGTTISVVYQGTSYTDVNKKVTVYVYNAAAGSSTYSASSAAGTAKVSGYYLSANSTAATRSASTTLNSTSTANNTFIPGITLTATAATGYKFVGWYSSTSDTTAISTDATFSTSHEGSDKTYYARFEKLATITYNANGKTASNMPSAQTVASDYTVTLSSNTPTASGYTFTSWNTAANGTGTTYQKSAKLTGVKSNLTLYAQWQVACSLPTSVSISGETNPCAKSTQIYTATITGGADYDLVWTFPEGCTKTNETNNSITLTIGNASGNIICTAKCSESSTKASEPLAITVKTAPVKPTIQANKDIVDGTISLMSGESVIFTVPEIDGVTYTWYRGNNNIVHTGTTYTTNVKGSYTVKATNSCGEQISDAVSITVCEPINGLYWKIDDEDEKDIYCPGDEVEVTLTYEGSEAKAHAWGGNWSGNIDILADDYATGTVYTMTINKSGSVDLTLTGCDSKTAKTSTLTFEVVEAPVKPTITFSANPVGQNKPTTLTVGEYNGTLNNYTLYKDEVSQGAYTTPQTITIGEVYEYDYYVVATSKACPSLTATSETVTLEVQEAGAKIVQLGDLVLYANDNTDFVPMYVQKDGIVDIDGATKVTGYTWEYSANGTSDWTPCSTGYVANGAGMNNGGEKCNNWRANKVGYYRCMITYDKGSQPSNTLRVTQGTNIKTNKQHIGAQRNLPIISVNTGGNSFPSDPANGYPSAHADDVKAKISVDVKIFNADGTLHYDRKARMNYRGSSSLNFKKKSYAFVTGKEKTKNEKGDVDTGKANLFGLSDGAEDKDWVLYAATPDPTMMRNRLTFDLYQQMRPNDWGVNSKYVELVINGEYMGVYVLMDKITENEKRINITAGDGFIVKFDKTDVVDRYVDGKQSESDEKTFKTERTGRKGISTYGTTVDQLFEIEYPEKEDTEDAGGNWTSVVETIKDHFEKFETALANKDYTAVRTLIDYDSWADWFILTEFIKNQDGFRASCIFVYNGGKIEARPLWDQELSFDNRTRMAHGSNSAEDLIIQSDGVYSDCFPAPFWFYGKNATFGTCGNNFGNSGSGTRYSGYLLADPCFVSLVKSKWATYQTGILSAKNISDMVSVYATELGNAQTREESRWPYDEGTRGTTKNGLYIGYYAGEGDSNYFGYSASKSSITTWATNRSTPLGENTNGLGEALYKLEGDALIFTINPSTIETSPWQQNVITVNAPTGYEYEINFSALTNVGTEVKENGDSYTFKVPRPGEWGTAGNGTAKSVQYTISATIDAEGENACGTQISNTATSVVTLKDVTENCSPEVKP